MKFAAFYNNSSADRTQALQTIYGAINGGMDLSKTPLNHPTVRTVPALPVWSSLGNLPLGVQCEHMEYVSGSLITLNLMVLEATIVSGVQKNESAN